MVFLWFPHDFPMIFPWYSLLIPICPRIQGAVKQREVGVAELSLRCGAVGAKYLCRMLQLGDLR